MHEKPDYYARKAKQEGYPARSVFKLQEIQQKFHVIKPGMNVLDIGASPGSWSLFVLRLLKKRGSLTAVDLLPEHPNIVGEPYKFVQGDAFSPEIMEQIGEHGRFNLILCDAAPSTSGNRTVDAARSFSLAEQAVELSSRLLSRDGNLVVKIFQGSDHQTLFKRIQSLFLSAKSLKPQASRKKSVEIFFIGLRKREDPV
jgi:23S rRNA (uridine2552-2'-O)-methyltransferase